MTDLNTIISALNLFGIGGMGLFIYYLIKGLKERINSLSELAEEQQKTLVVVKDRAEETDKLSQYYKKALEDFQDMGQKIEERRKELIREQEDAIRRKDDEIAKLTSLEIQELELKEKSFKKLPELERQLENAVKELKKQLTIIIPDDFDTANYRRIASTPLIIHTTPGAGKSALISKFLEERIKGEMEGVGIRITKQKSKEGDGDEKDT